ncbi:hypothetical protein BC828DRAFT_395541 [Blastocladiella britannica]|nr:hypothetical protein BC828DRAFT_395541 [Blastocladiella britannica]
MVFPALVLDRIFCHVVDNVQAPNFYPREWHACLMVTLPAEMPMLVRAILRNSDSFSPLQVVDPPSLALLEVWMAAFDYNELEFDINQLLQLAVQQSVAHLEFWKKHSRDPLTVSEDLIHSASGGVAVLDWLWDTHVNHLCLPARDFPTSVWVIDSAREDVAALSWWWVKHQEFGVPFEYEMAPIKAFRAGNIAVLQWWEERVVNDGWKLELLMTEYGSPGFDPVIRRPVDFSDLATIASDGKVAALHWWKRMFLAGYLPPVGLAQAYAYDVFHTHIILDTEALTWWAQMHVEHDLPMPDLATLADYATRDNAVPALEWLRHAHNRYPKLEITFPNNIVANKENKEAVEWWLALQREGEHKLGPIVWDSLRDDTLDDILWWWDLQNRDGVSISLDDDDLYAADLATLQWAHGRRTPDGKLMTVAWGHIFETAWEARNKPLLEWLVSDSMKDSVNIGSTSPVALLKWAVEYGGHEDLVLWWAAQPLLQVPWTEEELLKLVSGSLSFPVATPAHLSWWLSFADTQLNPGQLDRTRLFQEYWPLKRLPHNHAALLRVLEIWLVAVGELFIASENMDQLLTKTYKYGPRQVLRWLAAHEEDPRVTISVPSREPLVKRWATWKRVDGLRAL